MATQTVVRVRAAFADERHARRALGLLASAIGVPINGAIAMTGADRPTVVDLDVDDELHERVLGLVRMTRGVPLPTS